MAGKLLKETKDTENKNKKREKKVKENDIYKIDLDIEQDISKDKLQNELESFSQSESELQDLEKNIQIDEEEKSEETKKRKTKQVKTEKKKDKSIRKIEEDDDEIDEIFGNVDRWLSDDDLNEKEEKTEKKTRKRLTKIEDGIKSSKVTKEKKVTAKKTTTKASKTAVANKKATKKTAKSLIDSELQENDIYNFDNLDENEKDYTISDKQSEIKMQAINDLTEITLKNNRYKIELQKSEYNIYTETNESSYIIVREPGLKIISGELYILLKKQDEDYEITTNQDFKINYVIDNLERKENIVNFKLTNLTEIVANEEGLTFEIDAEKVVENNLEDNHTLIISEEDGKVYLPYTKEDIKNEVVQNKGIKISELIENKYILPLDKYKNSMRARFREGYNLMYKKERKSKRSAFLLGLELMFETNLHPAIISACKNLEELDIYLDCLEDNELEKFSCFKIIYKSLPTLRKKAKFQEF